MVLVHKAYDDEAAKSYANIASNLDSYGTVNYFDDIAERNSYVSYISKALNTSEYFWDLKYNA